MNTIVLFITTICFFGLINAKISIGPNFLNPLDRDLHQKVLDPDECQRQLQYIRWNNTLLLAQSSNVGKTRILRQLILSYIILCASLKVVPATWLLVEVAFITAQLTWTVLEAGLRIPRGVLQGNLNDYGNYHQCLDIYQGEQDMDIHGKFCLIRVPANQNFNTTTSQTISPNFNPTSLNLPVNTIRKLEERNEHIDNMHSIFGNALGYSSADNPLSNVAFKLALCIPKVCTTKEALSNSLINITDLGFQYEDIYCRLPNDKPWVTVDYIAIVIFSLIGLLTLLSTSYDVYYIVVSKKDPKHINSILTIFSAYTNCQRLLIIKSNPNAIECLDGIRALATLWVVIGHSFFVFNFFPANTLDVLAFTRSYHSIMVMTGLLSVDTFFLMSGLLLVYTCANKLTGCQLIRQLPVFYLNRLLRLFPVLAAVILFEASLYNRLGDGPAWDNMFLYVQICRTSWWTTLLHLQNFLNPQQVCIPVSWYLAIDVQLHILSPLVLFWVLGREKRVAWSALFLVLLLSQAASTAYIFANEFSSEGLNYFVHVYVNILTRAPPFFVGMIYGYVLHIVRGKKSKIPNKISYCLTTLSILLLALIIYCKFTGDQPDFKYPAIKDLYDSFLRPFWAVGLGWIIYVCHTGSGGPINWLLTLNIWKIPSRISYAIYLIHFSFMLMVYSNALQPLYFTAGRVLFFAMGFILIAFVLGFIVTVVIDAPFAILCKLLLGLAAGRQKKKAENNEKGPVNNNLPVLEQKHQDKIVPHRNSIDNSQKA